ncbi:MAG: alpha/beta hydrolase, partial [Gammaproteobacteria bacterium]
QFVRVGVARVELGQKEFTWEFARQISMLTSRTEKYPVKVEGAEEWGMLGEAFPYYADIDLVGDGNPPPDATQRYVDAINAQLARSERKDVYIYVHGYKVVYENPLLVASELWHFLGYDGVFIAYAWPSTPSKFAYIKDSDTSAGFARNLRTLLEVLAERTDAEQIHVIGYSNGTRLVTRALEQLALINKGKTAAEIHAKQRIGNVILIGSDLDRGVFGSYVADGLLNVPTHMSIYMSDYDKALGVSQFLTRRQRLGQMWGGSGGEMGPAARKALVDLRHQISFIDVTDAEGAETGNGHGYFRNSPWASSDILMTLYFDLDPVARGLIDDPDLPVYDFPPDYVQRLWSSIEKISPEFAAEYAKVKADLERKAEEKKSGKK